MDVVFEVSFYDSCCGIFKLFSSLLVYCADDVLVFFCYLRRGDEE